MDLFGLLNFFVVIVVLIFVIFAPSVYSMLSDSCSFCLECFLPFHCADYDYIHVGMETDGELLGQSDNEVDSVPRNEKLKNLYIEPE